MSENHGARRICFRTPPDTATEIYFHTSQGVSYVMAGGQPASPSWYRAPPGLTR